MKVLYIYIETFFGNVDMLEALANYRGEKGETIDVVKFKYEYTRGKKESGDPEVEAALLKAIKDNDPAFVFSFNFLPIISKVCAGAGVKYVSWVYDSPEVYLYSYQAINPCNLILTFDNAQFEEFHNAGIDTLQYLPLAAGVKRLSALEPDRKAAEKYGADISFVGSLYSEAGKSGLYSQVSEGISEYSRGFIDGLIRAQLNVYGFNFIKESLTPEVVKDILSTGEFIIRPDGVETYEYLIADYMLNKQATVVERRELLALLGKHFNVRLYSYDENRAAVPEGVEFAGPLVYYKQMPLAFKCSKINLNITLRSIRSGIPLRCFDILGSGGFLMTNYQPDFERHFVAGEDYVYWDSREDLIAKADYYLRNDAEREEIAKNGLNKVAAEHTFDVRVKQILEMLGF